MAAWSGGQSCLLNVRGLGMVQGGLAAAGGGLVIGRRRGREFRHDPRGERSRGVAQVVGEFCGGAGPGDPDGTGAGWPGAVRGSGVGVVGADLVRVRRRLRPDHWMGRAATTRNETRAALSMVTRAVLWDVPGRPSEDVAWTQSGKCHGAMPRGRAAGAAERIDDCFLRDRAVIPAGSQPVRTVRFACGGRFDGRAPKLVEARPRWGTSRSAECGDGWVVEGCGGVGQS